MNDPHTLSMITIADPEKWANVRAKPIADVHRGADGIPGHLIAIVTSQVEPLPPPPRWEHGQEVREPKSPPMTVAYAVYADPVDQVMTRLLQERDRHASATHALDEVMDKLEKELKAAEKKMAAMNDETFRLQATMKGLDVEVGTLRTRARAMELELAKVRDHVGAKIYNEAIGK